MIECRILREYAEFVAVTKAYAAKTSDRKAALSRAVDDCIARNVLADFLRTYRAEVLGMLLEEFDAKKYERSIREEGREEGIALGREESIALGREEGIALGREEGIALGMESGEYKKLVFIISRMKAKGCTAEETADMLEEDFALVTKVYTALEACDANTEWEKIVELI